MKAEDFLNQETKPVGEKITSKGMSAEAFLDMPTEEPIGETVIPDIAQERPPTMFERGKEAATEFFRPSFAPEPAVPSGMEGMPESAIPAGMSMDIPARRAEIDERFSQIDAEVTTGNIEGLQAQIEELSSQAVDGALPPDLYKQYTALRPQYEKAVEDYNAGITEAQGLTGELQDLEQQEYGMAMARPVSTVTGKPVPTPEERMLGGITEPGKFDFMDRAREIKEEGVVPFIPFVSGAKEVKDIAQVSAAAYKLKEGTATPEEKVDLLEFVEKASRDTTFGYKVINTVAAMPAFMGEFLLTSGLYSAGRKVGTRAATKTLEGYLGKVGRKLLEKDLGKIGVGIAGGVAGGTLQAPIMGAPRIVSGTIERSMPKLKLSRNEQGEINAVIAGEGEDLLVASTMALGDQWAETVSEHSGGLFRMLNGSAKNAAIRAGLFSATMKANPGMSPNKVNTLFNKMAYHGVINEILEERVGEGLRAGLGLQEYKIPTAEQLAVELVSFSVPGVIQVLGARAFRGPKPTEAPPKALPLAAPDLSETQRELAKEVIREKMAERPLPPAIPERQIPLAPPGMPSPGIPPVTPEPMAELPPGQGFGLIEPTPEIRLRPGPERIEGPEYPEGAEYVAGRPAPEELEVEYKPILGSHGLPWKEEERALKAFESKRLIEAGITEETHEVVPIKNGFGIIRKTAVEKEIVEPEVVPEVEKPEVEVSPAKEEVPVEPVKPEVIKIPELKNTEEALAFGKTATPEQIKALKAKRDESLSKADALKDKDDLQGAMDEAVRGQLFREAIESAEGKVVEVKKPKEPVVFDMPKFPKDDFDNEIKALNQYLVEHDSKKGRVPAKKPYLKTRDEEFAKIVGDTDYQDSNIAGGVEDVRQAIWTGEKLGYHPDDIAKYLEQNYVEGVSGGGKIISQIERPKEPVAEVPAKEPWETKQEEYIDNINKEYQAKKEEIETKEKNTLSEIDAKQSRDITPKRGRQISNQYEEAKKKFYEKRMRLDEVYHELRYKDGKFVTKHQDVIKKALKSGQLTPEAYTKLHEKDYGPLAEFMPEVVEKAKPEAKVEKFEEIYRGEGGPSVKEGRYWSPDKEWAAQFTQTGRLSEVKSGRIKSSDIYEASPLTEATDPDAIDAAAKLAKKEGFKAIRLDEGKREPDSVYIFDRTAIKPEKIKKEPLSETKSRLLANIKSEKGSSELINDLSRLGADAMRRGHTTYKAFTAEMKSELSSVWEKIKSLIRKAYFAAKKVVATVKKWNEKPDTWEIYDKKSGDIVDVLKPGENKIEYADIDILLGVDKKYGIRKAKKIPVEMLPRIIKSERGAVEIGKPKPKPEVGREVISKDGTTVDWDRSRVITKEKVTHKCYATYNKDGSFKKWRTREAINKIRALKKADVKYKERLGKAKDKFDVRVEKIKTAKEILKRRREKIRAVKEHFLLSDSDLRKITKRDIRLMSDFEFKQFIDDIRVKAEKFAERRQAVNELELLKKEKAFIGEENIRKFYKLPTVKNMTHKQLEEYAEILSGYEKGDQFLTPKRIGGIENTLWAGSRTVREVLEKASKEFDVPLSELRKVKVSEIDRFRYDTSLARQNPFYNFMVDTIRTAEIKSQFKYFKEREKLYRLAKAALKSRKRGILGRLVPRQKDLMNYLEAEGDAKIEMAEKLTVEEIALAEGIEDFYRRAYNWLLISQELKTSRFEDKYVMHAKRPISELLIDLKDTGIKSAVKDLLNRWRLDEAQFKILDSKTGEILRMKKFFRQTLYRTGELTPTKNIVKATDIYMQQFFQKMALDESVPAIETLAMALRPKEKTRTGIFLNDSLMTFVKEYLNTKKGRAINIGIQQGGKVDTVIRFTNQIISLRYIALNIPLELAAIVGETTAKLPALGNRKLILANIRRHTPRGRRILKKYKAYTGEGVLEEALQPARNIGENINLLLYGLFKWSRRVTKQDILLGNMTKAEFEAETISSEKLAEATKMTGRWLDIEGAKSIMGTTSSGAAITKFKGWAIPIVSSTAQNAASLARTLTRVGNPKKRLTRQQFQELYRIAEMGAIVAAVASLNVDDDDKDTFVGRLKYYVIRELGTIYNALSPRTMLTFGVTIAFLEKLSQNLYTLMTLEKYKTKDELKGVRALKKQLTPAAISQFKEKKKPEPKKKKGRLTGGLSGGGLKSRLK